MNFAFALIYSAVNRRQAHPVNSFLQGERGKEMLAVWRVSNHQEGKPLGGGIEVSG